jgi:hypothetical protein
MLRRGVAPFLAAAFLAGCGTTTPPPGPVASVTSAPPPAPPAAEPPPIPLHKPTPPRPPAAAPTEVAKLEPPATPPESPPPESTVLPPPELVGMDTNLLAQTLGQPAARRDSPPAVIWQYVDGDCSVDVYLYRDVQTDALHALYVELNGDDRTEQRRQSCLRRLSQRPADDRRPGPDPATAR